MKHLSAENQSGFLPMFFDSVFKSPYPFAFSLSELCPEIELLVYFWGLFLTALCFVLLFLASVAHSHHFLWRVTLASGVHALQDIQNGHVNPHLST